LLPAGDHPSSAVVWQIDDERLCTCAVDVDKQSKLVYPLDASSLIAKTLVLMSKFRLTDTTDHNFIHIFASNQSLWKSLGLPKHPKSHNHRRESSAK